MEDIHSNNMTLGDLFNALNMVATEHQHKIVRSMTIIDVDNDMQMFFPMLLRPNTKITWDCEGNFINLTFIQPSKEDTK